MWRGMPRGYWPLHDYRDLPLFELPHSRASVRCPIPCCSYRRYRWRDAVVLWRKDQVRCVRGCDQLTAYRLTPEAPSRRMVASCCETPMFGDFTRGFWILIYRARVVDAPAPSMRVMTSDAPNGSAFPNDGLQRYRSRPSKFVVKLLTTWLAMGLRSPKLACVPD